MIVGLGVDIAEVDRIEAAVGRHGERFLQRIFTPKEISYCESHKNRFERYAGRFAAKEAAMKALGTGWGQGVRWVDIEVLRQPGGRPTIQLAGAAREHADRLGVTRVSLSITHTNHTALAQVILES
jgi:holo-[acyl-carrier protein] synthase